MYGEEDSLDPALVEQVMGLRRLQPQQMQLQRQQQLADQLRGASMRGPGQVQGRPSFLQPFAQMAQGYAGKKLDERASAGMQDIAGKQADILGQYFKAARGRRPAMSMAQRAPSSAIDDGFSSDPQAGY
jgi:hypothetical protein